ncbi:MAG: o-succinylbenzoate synthase [Hormoscilla sp.]
MAEHYQFEFRPYQRRFRRSLTTSHGEWHVRQGIIVRLRDATGKVSWGEIAPLPWFGSETWEQALSFCQNLPSEITWDIIKAIPDDLPACQFGFESAIDTLPFVGSPQTPLKKGGFRKPPLLQGGVWGGSLATNADHTQSQESSSHDESITYSYLLPAGPESLQSWPGFWHQGYRTFKWKIAVMPIVEELKIFAQLTKELPRGTKLRLDANGGLTWEEACQWLDACEGKAVEFIEQPLAVEKFEEMQKLSGQYSTLIALDESVAGIDRLETCYHRGWRSIFVIKAAIAGSPSRLRQFCQSHPIDIVFSSVMETAIGRNAALKLAAELQVGERAVGFGVQQWFAENDDKWVQQLWE